MKNFKFCPAKRKKISQSFKIYQSHTNDKNIFNLVPLKEGEIQNDENIFNLVPLNGEGFPNDKNIFNLVPLKEGEIQNNENIFNLVPPAPAKQRTFEMMKIFSILSY